MLETAAPKMMQDHYNRAHCLRARAFADAWQALHNALRRMQKGPRLSARPQPC